MTRSSATNKNTRAFTIVELLVTILVIFTIMGIALVSYRAATNSARRVSDRALVSGLKVSIESFKREFGFIPPLVKDNGLDGQSESPIIVVDSLPIPATFTPALRDDLEILRGERDDLKRYSLYSLAYYLIGATDAPIDGIDGPGFVEVRRAGNFAPFVAPESVPGRDGSDVPIARRGPKKYDPFFDTERGGVDLYIDTQNRVTLPGNGPGTISRTRLIYRTEIRDRNNVAIRYYRWYKDDEAELGGDPIADYTDDAIDFDDPVTGLIAYLNVPRLVLEAYGDPLATRFEMPQELRAATFAIVAAGPNGLFGDREEEDLLASDADLQKRYAERLGLSLTRLASDAGYRAEAVATAREDNIVEVGS